MVVGLPAHDILSSVSAVYSSPFISMKPGLSVSGVRLLQPNDRISVWVYAEGDSGWF